jgi:hypothetical protein
MLTQIGEIGRNLPVTTVLEAQRQNQLASALKSHSHALEMGQNFAKRHA